VQRVKNLLTAGAETKWRFTETKGTALHLAVETGHLECARALLETNTKLLNLQDLLLRTPLHVAVTHNKLDIVLLLLEYQALLSLCDKQGKTPVYLALFAGKEEIANLLLEKATEYINNEKEDACGMSMLHISSYFGINPKRNLSKRW
jgi:ankyrin repeat protein